MQEWTLKLCKLLANLYGFYQNADKSEQLIDTFMNNGDFHTEFLSKLMADDPNKKRRFLSNEHKRFPFIFGRSLFYMM